MGNVIDITDKVINQKLENMPKRRQEIARRIIELAEKQGNSLHDVIYSGAGCKATRLLVNEFVRSGQEYSDLIKLVG